MSLDDDASSGRMWTRCEAIVYHRRFIAGEMFTAPWHHIADVFPVQSLSYWLTMSCLTVMHPSLQWREIISSGRGLTGASPLCFRHGNVSFPVMKPNDRAQIFTRVGQGLLHTRVNLLARKCHVCILSHTNSKTCTRGRALCTATNNNKNCSQKPGVHIAPTQCKWRGALTITTGAALSGQERRCQITRSPPRCWHSGRFGTNCGLQ